MLTRYDAVSGASHSIQATIAILHAVRLDDTVECCVLRHLHFSAWVHKLRRAIVEIHNVESDLNISCRIDIS